jgi:non-homologous end joining protein Ku
MASVAKDVVLSLGLISTTVRIESAKVTATSALKTVCDGQGGHEHLPQSISSVYTCGVCGPIENRSTLKKGKKVGDGYAIVEADEIQGIKDETSTTFKKQIGLTPHPADEVRLTTASGDKLYYLVPANGDTRYGALVELVKSRPDLAFCALWTPRTRASVFMLSVRDDVLVMEERTRAEELKPTPAVEAPSDPTLTAMAEQMLGLEGVVQRFDVAAYADTYEIRLATLVSSKDVVESGDAKAEGTPSGPAVGNDDLLAKLADMIAAGGKSS